MPRCFVAVEIPSDTIRRALEAEQGEIRRRCGRPDPVKWVPQHQFHVTLKFLGEIRMDEVARAVQGLGRVAERFAPFTLGGLGLGAFPALERPSVLWAGIGQGSREVTALAKDVEVELSQEGFGPEQKRFHPHITLGRVRQGALMPSAAVQYLKESKGREFGRWPVDRLVLMESRLTPSGPIYSVHKAFPLAGPV